MRNPLRHLLPLLALMLITGLTACNSHKKGTMTQEPLIALLTDYGMTDAFVAEMKGTILTTNPNVRLLDLTHEVEPFNIMQGAYLLSQSSREFPEGTIFIAGVDPGVGTQRVPLMVLTQAGKYYIGPDNGVLTLVIEREGFSKAWKLDRPGYYRHGVISSTDHGRDIFGPVAAHLAAGIPADSIGAPLTKKDLYALPYRAAAINGPNLTGEVWHIDRYGNIVTNIPASMDPNLKEGVLVRITLGKQTFSAPLVKTFADVQKGRVAVLVGSQGLLEICANQASAAKLVSAQAGLPVLIQR